jgi:hypothetical protein
MNAPSWSEIAQLVTALAALSAATLGFLNRAAIAQVHQTTNSKMDTMMDIQKSSSLAEGKLAGRAELASEQDAEKSRNEGTS